MTAKRSPTPDHFWPATRDTLHVLVESEPDSEGNQDWSIFWYGPDRFRGQCGGGNLSAAVRRWFDTWSHVILIGPSGKVLPTKPCKVRHRVRHDASPGDGLRQEWDEYQVVVDKKVLFRGGTVTEVKHWCVMNGYTVRT